MSVVHKVAHRRKSPKVQRRGNVTKCYLKSLVAAALIKKNKEQIVTLSLVKQHRE